MSEDTVAFQIGLRFGRTPIQAVLHVDPAVSDAARERLATYCDQAEMLDPILMGQITPVTARTNAALFKQKVLRERVKISLWVRDKNNAFVCSSNDVG